MSPPTGQGPRSAIPMSAFRNRATILFFLMSIASFVLIYLLPPSTHILFPAFEHVRETGKYPDGLSIRRTYTGVKALDEIFTGLAGFFSAAVDGKDEATRMFCLWFLPQLSVILVFLYWEAARTGARLVSLYVHNIISLLAFNELTIGSPGRLSLGCLRNSLQQASCCLCILLSTSARYR